jgi:hypothetical protein
VTLEIILVHKLHSQEINIAVFKRYEANKALFDLYEVRDEINQQLSSLTVHPNSIIRISGTNRTS